GASMPSVHSPSSLEELGTRPLRYFFRDVLHVERPEPEPGPDHLAPRLLGTAVHQLLHDLYAQLAREQAFEQEPAALQARAAALLQTRWESWVAALIGRHILRLPFLWREEARRWKRAISTFIAADLATIADEGWQPVDFELHVQRALELGHGTVLPVRGIFDRLLQQRGRRCVGDYKTGRADLKSRVGVTNMLRGIALQVPLYRMLAAAPGTDHPSDEELQVELLRIGLTDREAGEAPARRVLFAGFDATAQDDGFRETLRVLASLLRAGCFPLHHDGRICDHCDYALACRTNHVPTREREAHAVDGADFRDIKAKTATKETLLAGVRAAAARPPAGDEETP
ncbi:MAG: RecB family exonuclease, partial [Acidobacteriota bacterium]